MDIEEYVRNIDAETHPQPFIVIRGNKLKPTQAYVIIDRHILTAPTLIKAVDTCFKALFVLMWHIKVNVLVCGSSFSLLYLYSIDNGKSISSKIRELVRAFILSQ